MKKIALFIFLFSFAGAAFGQVTFRSVPVAFPQIAVGGDEGGQNYVTILQIVNNNSSFTVGHLALFSDSGAPLSVLIDGQGPQSTMDVTMDSGATRQIQLSLNGAVTAGWLAITYSPNDAQTTAIIQFRSGAALLSEVGVQPEFNGMSGTFFSAETDTAINTGIAVVNPDTVTANILARVWDPATGATLASTPISLPANGHVAKFLTELFPTATNITQIRAQVSLDACSDSTCSFAAPQGSIGFLATALRLNGSLFTTIPVINRPNGGNLVRVLPQVAIGGPSGGTNYQTVLYFTTDVSAGVFGTIDIFDDNGNPLAASANGAAAAASIPFTVLGNRVTRIALSGDQTLRSGWVRLTMPANVDLIANAVFQTFSGSTLVSEAGVLDSPPDLGGLIFVNVQSGISNVGVAFANSQPTPVVATLTLFNQAGFVAGTQTITLPANGHLAQFVTELFPQLASLSSFNGALNIDTPVAASAVALRLTGNNLATVPVGAQGMYRPSITGIRVTQALRTPAQVNFSVDVTDYDSDLATSASTAVKGFAYIDYGGGQFDLGPISLDGTAMVNHAVGTISGNFQPPNTPSGAIPSGFQALLYIYLYDSLGNQSNQVTIVVKF